MKKLSQYLFVTLLLFFSVLDAQACKRATEKINKFFDNRKIAMNNAKRDAKIPRTQPPYKVESTPMLDKAKKPIISNGEMVMTRQYYYKNTDGKSIVIQEHTFGHAGSTRAAGGMPHINVRPIDNIFTGKVPGTAGHYNIGQP